MKRVGGSRGSYAGSVDRRNQILDAGTEVFASAGYRAGSIQQIADLAGMSVAGVLHHFASKREILAAILRHRDEVWESRLRLVTSGEMPTGLNLPYALVDLLEHAAETPRLSGFFTRVLAEATSATHPAHEYLGQRYGRLLGMLDQAFTISRLRGELRGDVVPERAARQFVAVMDGVRVQWLYNPDEIDPAIEIRRFLFSLVATPR